MPPEKVDDLVNRRPVDRDQVIAGGVSGESRLMRRNTPMTMRTDLRRQMILEDLAAHPLSSAREISDRIFTQTRGSLGPGDRGLYIPPHRIADDLKLLETYRQVRRFQLPECRSISWQVVQRDD